MVSGVELAGGLYLVTAVVALLFLYPVRKNPETPGSFGFTAVVVGSSMWAGTAGVTAFVPTLDVTLFTFSLQLFAGQIAFAGWLLVAVEFANTDWFTRRLLGAIGWFVVLSQVVIWTNPVHHLMWANPQVVNHFLEVQYSSFWWAFIAGNYLMLSVGIVLMAWVAVRSSKARRRQAGALAFAAVPVFALTLATILDWPGGHRYNLTPVGFTLAIPLISWALYRARFLDVVPVARNTVVEEMDDVVLTLDDDDRVVDFNAAAERLLDVDAASIGRPAREVLADYPEAVERYADARDVDTEVSLHVNGTERHFDLSISPLGDGSTTDGRVVVLREITTLKRREQQLRERERQLDLLRQVLSRVLRHNLRNDMQVVRYCVEELPDADDERTRELVETATTTIEGLVAASEKARRIERVLKQNEDVVERDVVEVVERVVREMREEYPDATVETDCPATARAVVHPDLVLAVEDLVENAVVHNSGGTPFVEISVEENGDEVRVSVRDDGPGIPSNELDVLRAGRETDLQHGTGGGLWVVTLFVELSDGDLTFDTSPQGTTVTMHLPAAVDGDRSAMGE